MGNNALLALQIASQLIAQLENINQLVVQAQSSGVDLTAEQLDGLAGDYGAAKAQLDTDIAAAKAAGK